VATTLNIGFIKGWLNVDRNSTMKCANFFYRRCSIRSKTNAYLFVAVISLVGLSACANKPEGRYSIAQDIAPNFDYGQIQYQTVTPKFEPYNVWTSRPYKVLGEYYTPMQHAKGYEGKGVASWYGQKFHGHKTANGEVFDMFGLTAAHTTLPLPSFVKVTNLANNKSITVRVNDRGPFHDNRIIDLSYGAAKKLGYHESGVADVKVEVIHVSQAGDVTIGRQATQYANNDDMQIAQQVITQPAPRIQTNNVASSEEVTPQPSQTASDMQSEQSVQNNGLFVQVMAMQNGDKAKDLAMGLASLLQVPTHLPKIENVYRLQLGPLADQQKAKKLIQDLGKLGFDQAFTIEISPQ
jgi:rare lipoprotein A